MTQAEYLAYQARCNAVRETPGPMPDSSPESDLHANILDECRRRGWLALHGSMAHATHRTPGEPDFIILADNGRTLLVECKSKSGKLSAAQQAFACHAAHLGHTVQLVRSFREFVARL